MFESSCSHRNQKFIYLLIKFATVLAIASLLICQFIEADVCLHITIGRDIIANLAVPPTDYFTAVAYMVEVITILICCFRLRFAVADRIAGTKAVFFFHITLEFY